MIQDATQHMEGLEPEVNRGYYTAAGAKIWILFSSSKNTVFYHEKIKFISSSHRVIFFLSYRQEYFHANNSVRAENDVIDILIGEDMENTPLESRM